MKPHVVSMACHRVQRALDEGMSEGSLNLPAELAAHAAHCPRCGPEVEATHTLLTRLRDGAARVDLGKVPGVVDRVVAHTVGARGSAEGRSGSALPAAPSQKAHLRWVLGQVAIVATVLLVTLTGLTYGLLKMNEAVSGVRPGEVVERAMAPLRNWSQAIFGNAK